MKTKIWRYTFWIIFTGAIGAMIQTKAAVITPQDVLKGFFVGGGIGFFFASIFDARRSVKHDKKDN